MKLATQRKKTPALRDPAHYVRPARTLPRTPRGHDGSVQDEEAGNTFMVQMLHEADVTAKEFRGWLLLSKTGQQKMYRGELNDPVERMKKIVELIKKKNPPHLTMILSMLFLHIAGDGFDNLVIERVRTALTKPEATC